MSATNLASSNMLRGARREAALDGTWNLIASKPIPTGIGLCGIGLAVSGASLQIGASGDGKVLSVLANCAMQAACVRVVAPGTLLAFKKTNARPLGAIAGFECTGCILQQNFAEGKPSKENEKQSVSEISLTLVNDTTLEVQGLWSLPGKVTYRRSARQPEIGLKEFEHQMEPLRACLAPPKNRFPLTAVHESI